MKNLQQNGFSGKEQSQHLRLLELQEDWHRLENATFKYVGTCSCGGELVEEVGMYLPIFCTTCEV